VDLWEEGFKLFSMTVIILASDFFTYSVTHSGLIIGGPKPGVDGSFLKLLRLFKTLIITS
jgi:hypothetical protein